MFLNYDEKNRLLQISFSGEIDHHTCLEISQRSDEAIKKYLPSVVVFDFNDVSFMDSSGIGMLLGRYKKIIRYGGQAYIKNTSMDINRVFSMSGIFKIMPILKEEAFNG